MKPNSRTLLRYLGAVAIVVAASVAADVLWRLTGTSRLTSIFLSSVLLAAFYLGSGPGYLAAGLALIAHLYLVDPPYRMSLGSIDEMNALLLFLAASVLTCLLAGRVRGERRASIERARMSGLLLDATRELSAAEDEGYIRARLAQRLYSVANAEALVLDGERMEAAPSARPDADEPLCAAASAEAAARGGMLETQTIGGWRFRALAAAGQVFGVAGWRAPPGRGLAREEEAAIELLTDTGAAAIARARATAARAEAEGRARTEDLRNALLSSISHDLRTPLATIMGSASSLRRFADTFEVETRRDLAASIEEEAARLEAFVSNLLRMSRLQSGAVRLERVAFSVPEAVRATLDRRVPAETQVILTLDPALPEALGDPVLFEQALGNVVENAVRYAGGAGPLTIRAGSRDGEVRVSVEDRGPGVAARDLERIFEKFYRAAAPETAGGTGLGLAISRGLMEGMDGRISARASAEGGLCVELALQAAT